MLLLRLMVLQNSDTTLRMQLLSETIDLLLNILTNRYQLLSLLIYTGHTRTSRGRHEHHQSC